MTKTLTVEVNNTAFFPQLTKVVRIRSSLDSFELDNRIIGRIAFN